MTRNLYHCFLLAVGLMQPEVSSAQIKSKPFREPTAAQWAEMSALNKEAEELGCNSRYDESEAKYRVLIAMRERVCGADHVDTLKIRRDMVRWWYYQKRYAEAEKELRSILAVEERVSGREMPCAAHTRQELGELMLRQGKDFEAAVELRATVVALKRNAKMATLQFSREAWNSRIPYTKLQLSAVLLRCGEHAEAEVEASEALAMWEKAGGNGPALDEARANMVKAMLKQDKYVELEDQRRERVALENRVRRDGWRETRPEHHNMALSFDAQGLHVEAEKEHRIVLAMCRCEMNDEQLEVLHTFLDLARCLRAQDEERWKEALHYAQKAEKGLVKTFGALHAFSTEATQVREEIEAARKQPAKQ